MNLVSAMTAGVRITSKDIVIKMYPSEVRGRYKTKEYPEGCKNEIRRERYQGRQILFHRTQEFYATLNIFPLQFISNLREPKCWGVMSRKEKLIYIRYRYAKERWAYYMRTSEGHKPNRNAAKPWAIIRDDAYDYLKSNPSIREVL
jgi:hypothetical protein